MKNEYINTFNTTLPSSLQNLKSGDQSYFVWGGCLLTFICVIIILLDCPCFPYSLMKDYFYKPPLNKLSLTFLKKSLESAYRISYQEEVGVGVSACEGFFVPIC